jgi:hypothetical protein
MPKAIAFRCSIRTAIANPVIGNHRVFARNIRFHRRSVPPLLSGKHQGNISGPLVALTGRQVRVPANIEIAYQRPRLSHGGAFGERSAGAINRGAEALCNARPRTRTHTHTRSSTRATPLEAHFRSTIPIFAP